MILYFCQQYTIYIFFNVKGKVLNRHFTEEAIQSINTWKKCSTSLVMREMQIKTTLRFHLTSIRMAIIKNISNNKCWRGWGGKRYTYTLLVALQIDAASLKSSMKIPRKTGIGSTLWPSYPTHWFITRGLKISILKIH